MTRTFRLDDLPDDTLVVILSSCSLADVAHVSQVNRQLHSVLSSDEYWKSRFLADFSMFAESAAEYKEGEVYHLYKHYFRTVRGWSNPKGGRLLSTIKLPGEIYSMETTVSGDILVGLSGASVLSVVTLQGSGPDKSLKLTSRTVSLPVTGPYSMASDGDLLAVGFGSGSGLAGFRLHDMEQIFMDRRPNTVLDCFVSGTRCCYSSYFGNKTFVSDLVADKYLLELPTENPAAQFISGDNVYVGGRNEFFVYDLRLDTRVHHIKQPNDVAFDLVWRIRQLAHSIYLGCFSNNVVMYDDRNMATPLNHITLTPVLNAHAAAYHPEWPSADSDNVRSMVVDPWKVTVGTSANRVAVLDPATLQLRSLTQCGDPSSLDCLAFVGPFMVTGAFDQSLNLWTA